MIFYHCIVELVHSIFSTGWIVQFPKKEIRINNIFNMQGEFVRFVQSPNIDAASRGKRVVFLIVIQSKYIRLDLHR